MHIHRYSSWSVHAHYFYNLCWHFHVKHIMNKNNDFRQLCGIRGASVFPDEWYGGVSSGHAFSQRWGTIDGLIFHPAVKRKGRAMIRSELIKYLSEKVGVTHEVAELALNTIFNSMTEALAKDESIEIRGLGSFKVRHYAGRKGRNPKSGEIISVKPKRRPFFKVGKELKERVNKP